MPFRLGFADKKCSFFTVKNFTEQKFQVHRNWEMGHFSDPAAPVPLHQHSRLELLDELLHDVLQSEGAAGDAVLRPVVAVAVAQHQPQVGEHGGRRVVLLLQEFVAD